MTNCLPKLPGVSSGQVGQVTVEYALLLAFFAIPMLYVFTILLKVLAKYYGMITFLETLPFP